MIVFYLTHAGDERMPNFEGLALHSNENGC